MKIMKMRKRTYIILGVILLSLVVYVVGTSANDQKNKPLATANLANNTAQVEGNTATPDLPQKVLHSVPFTSQAPFGEWSDPRQQDGCEEASILMAAKWVKGETIASPQAAKDEILALSHKAEALFGAYADSSALDTFKLYKEYYKLTKGRVDNAPTIEKIKAELAKGNLVLVPADGRKLNNPNFSGGGPDRHFLVIVGYDQAKGTFITNDPGTRNGRSYSYTYGNLMESLHDYPTGNHLDTFKNDIAMIVIEKN